MIERDIEGVKTQLEQLPMLREILDTDGRVRLEAGLATRREQLADFEQMKDHFKKRLEDLGNEQVGEETVLQELRDYIGNHQERF